eukprot:TRINITY_DN12698_c0_g3_i1.p1 TRINITY_DN12698_c0_g3~~TRINITY_DN12698_c0_g3_i1.p1  ORF type:complete len:727 (+),score=55.33 TRINITY_DN12698_c0_g3_i1:68-2248(+)
MRRFAYVLSLSYGACVIGNGLETARCGQSAAADEFCQDVHVDETEDMDVQLLQQRVTARRIEKPRQMKSWWPFPWSHPTPAPTTAGCTGSPANETIRGVAQRCNSSAGGSLAAGQGCDPLCDQPFVPVGPYVCSANGQAFSGIGCTERPPPVPESDVDSVPDATQSSDMVYRDFLLLDHRQCLIWPGLPEEVKAFIVEQASKYGPSASHINAAKKLGQAKKTEFFLNVEQVSILVAQTLCGAVEVARGSSEGGPMQPQAFALGRAMEHWYYADAKGSGDIRVPRDSYWRRTTLVGYGTFGSDGDVPDHDSVVSTGTNMTITSGCDSGGVADSAIGDSDTMTVVFAGHYVGGWMYGWHNSNAHGAQEEKIGTLVPEMLLATDPTRKMGAGLLSNGAQDPWLPEGGWYILGAGSYVKGLGYPRWSSDPIEIRDSDYFAVGTERRIRRRGLVAILGKPCNDRGSCGSNSADHQYRCFNRQVDDNDLMPKPSANLWGIAAGAFDFANWPSKTGALLKGAQAAKNWVLQAGGWGAGAFGCGTLYGGLVQALAAKKGGWEHLRMCWAGRGDAQPSIESKFGYVAGEVSREIRNAPLQHLMIGHSIDDYESGRLVFMDSQYGAVAHQLRQKIHQASPLRTCATVMCDRWNNHQGNCQGNIDWCFWHGECAWHKNKSQDIRDFMAVSCNPDCGASAGICTQGSIPTPAPPEPPSTTSPPTTSDSPQTTSAESLS